MVFDDAYFMQRALAQAQQAFDQGEVPIGAVIVCENQVIAKGYNQTEKLSDVTAHAEMIAYTSASAFLSSKYMNQCSLYVTLMPCVMCTGMLRWAQFKRLVYAAKDSSKKTTDAFLNAHIHPKTELVSGIMAEESQHLLAQFFLSKRS